MNPPRLSMREAAAQAANLREVGEPVVVNFASIATQPEPSLASTQKPPPSVIQASHPTHAIDPTPQPALSVNWTPHSAPSVDLTPQPAPSIKPTPQPVQCTNQTLRPAPPIDRTRRPSPSPINQTARPIPAAPSQPATIRTIVTTPSITPIPSVFSSPQLATVASTKKRPAPEPVDTDKPDRAILSSKKARNELYPPFQPFQPTASSRKHTVENANPPPPLQPQHRNSQASRADSTPTQSTLRRFVPPLRSAQQPLSSVQTTSTRSEVAPRYAMGQNSYMEGVAPQRKRQISHAPAKDVRVGVGSLEVQARAPQKDVQRTSVPDPSQRHGELQRGQKQASPGRLQAPQACSSVARNQVQPPRAAPLSHQGEEEVSPWEEACRSRVAIREHTQRPDEQSVQPTLDGASADPRLEKFLRETRISRSFLTKYGLLIFDPRDGDTFTWVACKFCPTFHCRTRQSDYIMMYRTPFVGNAFIKHLSKEHSREWKMYSQASNEKKEAFFDNHPLPPRETFMKRLLELRKNWGSSEMAPNANSVAVGTSPGRASAGKQAVTPSIHTRSRTRSRLEFFGPQLGEFSSDEDSEGTGGIDDESTDYPLVSRDEMWAGRHRCQEVLSSNQAVTKTRKRKRVRISKNTMDPIHFDSVFRPTKHIVAEIPQLLLCGVLSDKNVRPASAKVGFLYPSHYGSDEILGKSTSSWNEAWAISLFSTVLFYLLRGVPLDVVNEMLIQMKLAAEGGDDGGGKEIVDEAQDVGIKKEGENEGSVEHHRFKGNYKPRSTENGKKRINNQEPEVFNVNDRGVEVKELNDDEQDENVSKGNQHQESERGNKYEEKEGMDAGEKSRIHLHVEDKDVWNCGNSICAEALQLLRLLHESSLNWAFCLATRRCEELGSGAVEVLVQTTARHHTRMWAHLVALRKAEGAAEVVKSLLECAIPRWRQRLVGLRSGLNANDLKEKVVERRVVDMLRKEEGVEEGFLCIEDVSKKMKIVFSEMTGVELVKLIRQHGMRYARMGGTNVDEETINLLKLEEEKLMRVSGKLSYGLDEVKAMEKVQQMAPQTTLMLRRLKRVWEFDLDDIEGEEYRRDQLGWFKSKRRGEEVVNVLLERVLFARELVKLRAAVKEVKRSMREVSTKRCMMMNLEKAQMWSRNWG